MAHVQHPLTTDGSGIAVDVLEQMTLARVSTVDQNLELQLSALKEVGCEKLYQDQILGTKANRPVLSEIFHAVKAVLFWSVVKLQVHKTASKQGSVPCVPSVLF